MKVLKKKKELERVLIPYGLKGALVSQNGVMKAHLLVTPGIAKEWLKGNSKNRPLRKKYAKDLSDAMVSGRWKYNGDPIRFGKNRDILDGQHRLVALVESELSFVMDIIVGIGDDVFETIDQGVGRTSTDVAHALGLVNYRVVGPAVAVYIKMCQDIAKGSQVACRLPKWRIKEFLEKNKNFDDVAGSALELYGPVTVLNKPTSVAFLWMLSAYDWDMALEFLEKIITGVGIADGCPTALYRNYVFKIKSTSGATLSGFALRAMLIKAWNAYIGDKPISILRYKSMEKYPVPILKKV